MNAPEVKNHIDQKYIDALLNNNEVLLRDIYKKFSGTIKRMVVQLGLSETDAEDIFQEALLSIYNRARVGGFVLTCPFEGLLYLICKRKCIKELKKKDRLKVRYITDQAFDIDDNFLEMANECLMHESRKALITENIKKLGEKCKELLYLSWNDRPMEEVAILLNMSYGYARKKKSGCMAKLINLIHGTPEYNSLNW